MQWHLLLNLAPKTKFNQVLNLVTRLFENIFVCRRFGESGGRFQESDRGEKVCKF